MPSSLHLSDLDPPLPSIPPSLLFSTLHLPPPAASPAPPCWPVMRLANQFGSLIFAQQTGEASAGSRAEEAAFLSQPPLIIFRFISWPLPLVSVSERTCADSYLNVLMLSKWLVMCKWDGERRGVELTPPLLCLRCRSGRCYELLGEWEDVDFTHIHHSAAQL